MSKKQKNTSHKQRIICCILLEILLLIAGIGFIGGTYYQNTYNIQFKEFLYTMVSPLKGTGGGMVVGILRDLLPPMLLWILASILLLFLMFQRRIQIVLQIRLGKFACKTGLFKGSVILCVCLSLGGLCFGISTLGIPAYIESITHQTTIYEDYYVDPSSVAISEPEASKNLIYIYLESMEISYASTEEGGLQEENYIPNLTELAYEYLSFSNTTGLGGFHSVTGTTWTMGALLGTSSGIPFSFPVANNSMNTRENFATGLTTLGDLLGSYGYTQEFLCGSDADFAGRRTFYEQHGNFKIFDLYTARDEGYIDDDYYVWWGYEDSILYEIAKDELLSLASEEEPFNFTMLTVDTHNSGGYICSLCEDEYDVETANVVACADQQLGNFISWIQEQDFYENTVIVITGDHPRRDTYLVGDVDASERLVYNCIINTDTNPESGTTERDFTSLDIFPTVLSALGFKIEGDRLGLGTDLFSSTPTLSEEYGYEWLDSEVSKYSTYYIEKFH